MLIDPLAVLIEVSEEHFRLEPGALAAQDRSQPVVSFRHLAWRVAKDAGYGYGDIARAFQKERTTVWHGAERAKHMIDSGFTWWMYNRADLFDKWEEALGRTD